MSKKRNVRRESVYGEGVTEGVTTISIPAPEGLVTGGTGFEQSINMAAVLNMFRTDRVDVSLPMYANIGKKKIKALRVTSCTFDCSSSSASDPARARITVSGGIGKFYTNELKPIKVSVPKTALVGLWQNLNSTANDYVPSTTGAMTVMQWYGAELVSIQVSVLLDPESVTS